MMRRAYWHNKFVRPLLELLKQGITPEKIALSVAFGVVIGVIPVLGSTTILCGLAAIVLGLNLPAIQLINYLVYPLQIILLIPFYRAGEFLFRVEALPLSASHVVAMIKEDMWAAIKFLWDTTLHAVVVWCLLAPVGIAVLYYGLLPVIRKLPLKSERTFEPNNSPES